MLPTKLISIQVHGVPNFDIFVSRYRRDKFFLGIDTEELSAGGLTGLNTRDDELMTVSFIYDSEGGSNISAYG